VLPPDAVVARVAAGQRNLVTFAQLLAAGLSRNAVAHRVRTGRLHRILHAVYAVGTPFLAPWAPEQAALLALGPAAALSHHTAAVRLELFPGDAPARPEVTLPGTSRSVRGVRTHRSATLLSTETVVVDGLRCTTAARTLLDLAAAVSDGALDRALNESYVRKLTTSAEIGRLLARHPGRRGSRRLARRIATDPPGVTRSEAERLALRLIRRAGLTVPRTNQRLADFEVDLLWPQERLVVEIDGFAFHATRDAFERDRRRDAELQARGYRVVRLTWRRLVDEPHAVVALLAGALARTPPVAEGRPMSSAPPPSPHAR
jgi:very-short-patch-repair endonuclease